MVNLLVRDQVEEYQAKQSQWSTLTYIIITCLLSLLLLIIPLIAKAENWTNEQIADAIYKAENSEKYPYGIKSIDTKDNEAYARKICLNTIRNNRKRFQNQNQYNDFIQFLGSRYCPPQAHKLNKNWVRNVKYWLNKGVTNGAGKGRNG